MPDDVTNEFLEDPSSAVEEYYESMEAAQNEDETLVDESYLESDDSVGLDYDALEGSALSFEEPPFSEDFYNPDFDYSNSDGLNIYGPDIPVTKVERVGDSAVGYAARSSSFSEDNTYDISFDNADYTLYIPSDQLDFMAIRDGELLNMGSETVYASVLDSDGSIDDYKLFCFNPVSSANGHQNKLRYGSYSYLRRYTLGGNNSYTSSDSYGSVLVVEEPPLFSGKPVVAYVVFALFAVFGFYLLKRLFRSRSV